MAKSADADSPQNTADADSPQESAYFRSEPNRVPEAVMAGIAVVFILGSILGSIVSEAGKGKKSPPGDVGVRALVLPTADRARTVVVPPCGTGTTVTARTAAAQIDTPGVTIVRLPPAERARVLLIPRCSASTSAAGAKTVAQVPSSLFVLATGSKTAVGTEGSAKKKKKKKKGEAEGGTIEPRSQLIVPSASEGEMVVVPPCSGSGRAHRATVLGPAAGSPTVLIAPPC